MGGLAVAVDWSGRRAADLAGRMLSAAAHRGPDGATLLSLGPAALGEARFVQRAGESPNAIVADGNLAVAADMRLDDADGLARSLGVTPGRLSDRGLILHAYRRDGPDFVQRVRGDFAIVIWDGDLGRVVACRDPFGVRPLFFRHRSNLALLASEPKQILAAPGVSAAPDDLIVGEFLFDRFEEMRQTFFDEVKRVRAGHRVVIDKSGLSDERWWWPDPAVEARFDDPEAYFTSFRENLRASVRARTRTDHPVGAQMSGGLDSSAVVAMATDLARGDPSFPEFETISAVFPGRDCDESAWIAAIVAGSGFPSRTFDPDDDPVIDGLVDDIWEIDSPFVDPQRATFDMTVQCLAGFGARTMLTGMGGDEVVHEEHYLGDLARQHRWLTLAREIMPAGTYSWNSRRRLLSIAMSPLLPDRFRRLARRMRAGRSSISDDDPRLAWVNPEFYRWYRQAPEPERLPDFGFPTRTQNDVVTYVGGFPGMGWALEALEAQMAHRSVEVSHPFLDRNLVEYVASIPLDARLPRGRWKVLIRRALAGDLPDAVLDRRRKTMFDSNAQRGLARHLEGLLDSLGPIAEESTPYLDSAGLAALVDRYRGGDTSPWVTGTVWRTALLRMFLAAGERYRAL